jgi:D-alanyl-D-alanine carboxypeptidase
MHALALALALAPRARGQIDHIVRYVMGEHHIDGLSLAVVRNGHIVYVRGYGFADRRRTIPTQPNTVFAIASLEKPFIAAAVLRLVERRELSLDDTIAKFVPWYTAARNVTVADLLANESGIPDYAQLPSFERSSRNPVSPEELVRRVSSLPLAFPPGTQWQYSNTDYVLLGMIVEKVTHVPVAAWLHRDLFAPLHLTDTATWQPMLPEPNRAEGSVAAGSPSLAFAAADVESNAVDLGDWVVDLLQGRVVDARDVRRMFGGMGFLTSRFEGLEVAWHSGYIEGYSSYLAIVPSERLGVVVLCNQDRVDLGPLALSVVEDALH